MTPSLPSGSAPVPVVVVGLDCITGLQTARIYWERGVPVIGIAADRGHFAARTRTCVAVTKSPTSGDALVEHLEKLARRLGQRAVLIPCTDGAVATIAAARTRLGKLYHVPLAEESVVMTLLDKVRFERWAAERGFPMPRTVVLRSREAAAEAAESLRFPAVLKPAVKTPRWQEFTNRKVIETASAAELMAAYDTYAPFADGLTAQEWIVGPETELYSCNAYFDAQSRPLASFVARKIRQWPPRTGTSCLGEECSNEVVRDTTLQVFAAARFHGLAYLEMKRDVRTGQHYIIEPNVGRPTGRSAIAETGGVELLMTAYCDTVGLPLPAAREQRGQGAKWVYLRNDVLSAFHYWRHGELSLDAWRRSLRGVTVDAVFARRDPMPFVVDLASTARKLGSATMRRAAASISALMRSVATSS